jgi:hypothetical protein
MDSIRAQQQTDKKRCQSQLCVFAIMMIVTILPVLYFVSVGPAFAITLEAITLNCDGPLHYRAVRAAYRPLFHLAPDLTCRYLRVYGVSEIEAFFLMQGAQGE